MPAQEEFGFEPDVAGDEFGFEPDAPPVQAAALAPPPSPVPDAPAIAATPEPAKQPSYTGPEIGFHPSKALGIVSDWAGQAIDQGAQALMPMGRDVPEPSMAEEVMFPGYAQVAKWGQHMVVAPAHKFAQDFLSGPINATMIAQRVLMKPTAPESMDTIQDYGEDFMPNETALARVVGTFMGEARTITDVGGAFSAAQKQALYEWRNLRSGQQTHDWFNKRYADEFLQREMAVFMGGDAVRLGASRDVNHQTVMNMDSPELLKAVNDLEQMSLDRPIASAVGAVGDLFGNHAGAAFLQAFAHGMGELPLYLAMGEAKLGQKAFDSLPARVARLLETGPKSETFMGTVVQAFQRAAKSGVQGALEGGAFGLGTAAVTEKEDLAHNTLLGAGAGFAMGGGLHLGMEAAAPVVRAAKPVIAAAKGASEKAFRAVFEMPHEHWQEFSQELLQASLSDDALRLAELGGQENAFAVSKARDLHTERHEVASSGERSPKERMTADSFWSNRTEMLKNPVTFGVYRAKSGVAVGRAIEIVQVDGKPRFVYHDTEMPTNRSMAEWVRRYEISGSDLTLHPELFTHAVDGTPYTPQQQADVIARFEKPLLSAFNRGITNQLNEAERRLGALKSKPQDDYAKAVAEAELQERREIAALQKELRARSKGQSKVIGIVGNKTMGAKPSNLSSTGDVPVRMSSDPLVYGDKITYSKPDGQQRGAVLLVDHGNGTMTIRVTKNASGKKLASPQVMRVARESIRPGHTAKAAKEVSKALRAPMEKQPEIDPDAIAALKNLQSSAHAQESLYVGGIKEAENNAREFFGVLKAEDLSNYIGHTSSEAVAAIENMAVATKGTKIGSTFIAPPSWSKAPDEGINVFIGKPARHPGELPTVGVYRGMDPKIPGNHLIDIAEASGGIKFDPLLKPPAYRANKTNQISIGRDEFNSIIPEHLGSEYLAQQPNVWGLSQPIPPDMVLLHNPGSITTAVSFDENLTKQAPGLGNKLARAVQSVVDFMQHQMLSGSSNLKNGKFSLPMFGPKVTVYSAKAGEAALRMTAQDSLLKATGLASESQASKALEPLLRLRSTLMPGEKASPLDLGLEQWVKDNPQIAATGMQHVRQMIDDVKFEQARHVQLTGGQSLGPDVAKLEFERALGNEDEYVKQSYNLFKLREDWLQYLQKSRPEVWKRAIDYLSKEQLAKGLPFTVSDVVVKLKKVLHETQGKGMNAVADAMQNYGLLDANAAKSLIGRTHIPEPLLALLGPTESGLEVLAGTWARAKSINNRIEAWNTIAESPWYSRGRRADLTVQVPLRPEYGKAAGGWVDPTWSDFLSEDKVEAAGSILHQMLVGTPGRMWKKNVTVLGGPAPWLSNNLRNYKGAVITGHDPLNPGELGNAMKEMAQYEIEWKKNPTRFGKGGMIDEMTRLGVVPPGFGQAELSLKQKHLDAKTLAALVSSTPFEESMMKVRDIYMTADEAVTNKYDGIDRIWKGASYLIRRRNNIASGMSQHDAAVEAALRVQQGFPNFTVMSKSVEALRKNGIGTLAPFFSSKIEDLRITGTTVMRTPNEQDLQARLIKLGVLLSGTFTAMKASRMANGVSDEMVQAEWNKMPQATRSMYKAPVFLDYDRNGRATFIDATSYDDMLMTMKGSPMDTGLGNFLRQTTADLVGDRTLMGSVANGVWAAAGNETAQNEMRRQMQGLPKPGQESTAQLIQYLAKESSMLPQAGYRLMDTLHLAGVGKSPYDRRDIFPPPAAVMKGLGAKIILGGDSQDMRGIREWQGVVKEYQRAMRGADRQADGNPEEADRLREGSLDRFQRGQEDIFKGRQSQ